VILTAKGRSCDFVLRAFVLGTRTFEEHVSGSALTRLVPYWVARLGKARLTAQQVSARGGEIQCEEAEGRVLVGGRAIRFAQGTIFV
jgi:predicted PhzF superfamily epimerase YddE/YHI9